MKNKMLYAIHASYHLQGPFIYFISNKLLRRGRATFIFVNGRDVYV